MPRKVPEWIGKTVDIAIPPRVRLRVLERDNNSCAVCHTPIHGGVRWETDHIKAIINGGQNRESNLQTLCKVCHIIKSKGDVAMKAYTAQLKSKHLGLKKSRWPAMAGTKRSGWRKRMDGTVERRE